MSEPQVMVVTGSASGIGRHLTGVLAAAGHRLVATDVDLSPLEKHARREGWPASQVLPRKLDVRDREAWEGVLDVAMATWGRLDVLLFWKRGEERRRALRGRGVLEEKP